jgi:pimeloyl-ACP methyl ester carboxylesterase
MDTAFGFGANGVNQTPTTPEDMTALNSAFTALGASCAANAPNLIKHLSTIEVARDMDIMRALLHQKTLTYMGASYGTYLGAWYAQLFPKRVGRFVLDGAIDPAVPAQQGWVDFAGGMELALHRFLADCPKHPVDCPSQLNGTASQNYATFENLVATITQTPVVVPGLEPLTRVRLMLGIASWLYDDAVGWERLRQALTSLWTSNDGRLFDENAYWWYGKDSATNSYDPSALQQDAILCLDRPSLPALADPNNQALAEAATVAPDFGDVFLWHEQICGNWPVQGSRPSSPLHAIGSPTIVVVGNKYDPATPYKHAVSLARQLQHARLLTWIGDGHTAYNRGSVCIDYAIDTFLVKGILPKVGKVCPAVPRA